MENKKQIIEMRKAGKSIIKIARHFGMDKMDVRDALAAGAKPKKKAE